MRRSEPGGRDWTNGKPLPERVASVKRAWIGLWNFFLAVRAHRGSLHDLVGGKIVDDPSGGQGDAETRPERRLRGQDRRRGARCVPFLFDISGIGAKAINLGGSGGQSPPAAILRCAWESFVVRGARLFGRQRRWKSRSWFAGSIAVVLFVRSCDRRLRLSGAVPGCTPYPSLRGFDG